MTLNQIAQQAMDYLDSVGVAADWGVYSYFMLGPSVLIVITDSETFYQSKIPYFSSDILSDIKSTYPQKIPEILTESYLKQYSERAEYLKENTLKEDMPSSHW